MDETTTGVLTIFMFLSVPTGSRLRHTRKNLVKLGGLTHEEAKEAMKLFKHANQMNLENSNLYSYWQPHPIELD